MSERDAPVVGHITYIADRRVCDICKYVDGNPDVTATHDAKTNEGPWANVCDAHFNSHTSGRLGTGVAQILVIGREPEIDRQAAFDQAVKSGSWDAMEEAMGDGDIMDFL